jgi:hypothetical protein
MTEQTFKVAVWIALHTGMAMSSVAKCTPNKKGIPDPNMMLLDMIF